MPSSTKTKQQIYWTQQARDLLARATVQLEAGNPEEALERAEEAVKALDKILLESGPTSPTTDPSPTSARAAEQ